jgi:subtilisin-like proprotein convertase family protein
MALQRFGATQTGNTRIQGGSEMKQFTLSALVVVVATMLGILGPLSAATSVAASKKPKPQHQTFSSANAIVIPDASTASPYPSTINVSGFKKSKITDVDVTLRGLNHGYSDDIDVLLVAPGGQGAIIMSDVGGSTNALSLTLTLDDQAPAALPDGDPLVSGTFQPANFSAAPDLFPGAPTANGTTLATFNGGDPNGAWQLYVVDDDTLDVGAFSGGWDLTITAAAKPEKQHHDKKHHHGHGHGHGK